MATKLGINSAAALGPLLPVTGSFALPYTAYLAFLNMRVVAIRLRQERYLGDGSGDQQDGGDGALLFQSSRAHLNFVENVPFAFVLAALAELNGGDRRWIAGALSALLAFRVSHAELGIVRSAGQGLGRPVGFFGTWGVLGGLAGYAAYLVKGSWDF